MITTSGRTRSAVSSAASAERTEATTVMSGSSPRIAARPLATISWSSTIMTVMGAPSRAVLVATRRGYFPTQSVWLR